MLAHPGQRRADAESIRVIVSGVVGKSAGVKSTATAFLVPSPFPNERRERETGISSSDTGHYRTCPSSFSRKERERERGDGLYRGSNEEKQSLKPAVRPIGRVGNAFYPRFYKPETFTVVLLPSNGTPPSNGTLVIASRYLYERIFFFSLFPPGKAGNLNRWNEDHLSNEWICWVNFFFFEFFERDPSFSRGGRVSVDLEEGESRVIYKRVKVSGTVLVRSKIDLSFVKWYMWCIV